MKKYTVRELYKKWVKDKHIIHTDNTETEVNFPNYINHYRSLGYEIREYRQTISN